MGFDFNIIIYFMYIMKVTYKPKQSNIVKLEKYLKNKENNGKRKL